MQAGFKQGPKARGDRLVAEGLLRGDDGQRGTGGAAIVGNGGVIEFDRLRDQRRGIGAGADRDDIVDPHPLVAIENAAVVGGAGR